MESVLVKSSTDNQYFHYITIPLHPFVVILFISIDTYHNFENDYEDEKKFCHFHFFPPLLKKNCISENGESFCFEHC